MVSFDQIFSMYVLRWFPRIIAVWIPFPLDEVLYLALTPKHAVIENGLDLVLLFSIDQVGM